MEVDVVLTYVKDDYRKSLITAVMPILCSVLSGGWNWTDCLAIVKEFAGVESQRSRLCRTHFLAFQHIWKEYSGAS